jgi:hypothetical protein
MGILLDLLRGSRKPHFVEIVEIRWVDREGAETTSATIRAKHFSGVMKSIFELSALLCFKLLHVAVNFP